MHFTADLHIHSHYAKATSKYLTLESLYQWAKIKGIDVIGTGDFTHPAWFAELKDKLLPDQNGFFTLKNPPKDFFGVKTSGDEVRFCLSSEINCEAFHMGKLRRIHNLVYAPDFETAEKINSKISRLCNPAEDGRPTIKLLSGNLLEIVLEASAEAHFVPAHIWTPWFSLLGSVYGYESVEECFGDLSQHIFALETSLSADPLMTAKLSTLDRFTLMSNSDAHRMENIGREINRFNTGLTYYDMFEAVRTKAGFLGTYEFFPALGKYYYDGHRDCKVSLPPQKSNVVKNTCTVCGKRVTIGTLGRSDKLSDRKEIPPTQSFEYTMPLPEILSEIYGVGDKSQKIKLEYGKIISALGNEMEVLHEVPVNDIQKRNHLLAIAISRMRNRRFEAIPGYDGVYGRINFFREGELEKLSQPQISLF